MRIATSLLLWVTIGLLVMLGPAGWAFAGDTWPTLHRDYQRSGFTPELLTGPFERKWYRDFHEEIIATRVEAIVAEDKCFVGTFAGNLYALDVATGRTVWRMEAAGPIGASPCYRDGVLYVGSEDRFDRGRLYAVRAADGQVLWDYQADGGVWVAPSCDGPTVYFGDRSGRFHAVDTQTGAGRWTFDTGYMILKPASFSLDGQKIVFGSEDMHVYCLSPDGKLIWKSAKLPGLSQRDQGPTIWRDMVVIRTNPTDGFHEVLHRNGEVLEAIQRRIPLPEGEKPLLDRWGDYMVEPTPQRRTAEIQGIIDYLKNNPHDQTFHTLDLATGQVKRISPIMFTVGLHNPPTPPTFNPDTAELYTTNRSALTYYLRGVRRYNSLCRLDPETGMPDWYFPDRQHTAKRMWYGVPLIGDETQSLSLMDDHLVVTHQGDIGAIDLAAEKAYRIWNGRDSYGGIFGPKAVGGWDQAKRLRRQGYLVSMPNEWHGPDRAIVAVAADRLFWVVGSQVVCLGGPDIRRTETGGTEYPPMKAWSLPPVVGGGNVATSEDPAAESAEDIQLTDAQLSRLVLQPERSIFTERSVPHEPWLGELRRRLNEQVGQLIDEGPWAPLAIQLGISKGEVHFQRTALTMQTLALAMPHLSVDLANRASAHLDRLFEQGVPLDKPVWPGDEGARREPYDLGPDLTQRARWTLEYQAGVADIYALYAYAAATDNFDKLRPLMPRLERMVDGLAVAEFAFDADQPRQSEKLNAEIAGLIGYARIADGLGQAEAVETALAALKPRMLARARHEATDRRLIRKQPNRLHAAAVYRYRSLTPQVSRCIGQLAGESLNRNVSDLTTGLPLWYQAFGERMIGGENYISPPEFSRGLFAALADGLNTDGVKLANFVDQPWCKADLYYIEKLVATLRNSQVR